MLIEHSYESIPGACRAAKFLGKAGNILKGAGSNMAHQAQVTFTKGNRKCMPLEPIGLQTIFSYLFGPVKYKSLSSILKHCFGIAAVLDFQLGNVVLHCVSETALV